MWMCLAVLVLMLCLGPVGRRAAGFSAGGRRAGQLWGPGVHQIGWKDGSPSIGGCRAGSGFPSPQVFKCYFAQAGTGAGQKEQLALNVTLKVK